MKVYEGKDIRNVGVVGHGHCGKTMLTSALLYTAGAVNRLTRPDEGNTVTDFDEEEIQRKITISTSRGGTPSGRRRRSISSILLASISSFRTRGRRWSRPMRCSSWWMASRAWKCKPKRSTAFAEEFHLPHAFFINKLDRERADFERCVDNIHEIFGRACVPIQLPIGQ